MLSKVFLVTRNGKPLTDRFTDSKVNRLRGMKIEKTWIAISENALKNKVKPLVYVRASGMTQCHSYCSFKLVIADYSIKSL
jgi:hypothetical protein